LLLEGLRIKRRLALVLLSLHLLSLELLGLELLGLELLSLELLSRELLSLKRDLRLHTSRHALPLAFADDLKEQIPDLAFVQLLLALRLPDAVQQTLSQLLLLTDQRRLAGVEQLTRLRAEGSQNLVAERRRLSEHRASQS